MATPRNSSYSGASGETLRGGRSSGGALPAWLSAVAVGEVKTISGTAGAGGAPVQFFCGMAWRPDTKELYIGWAGGHNDSGDNRIVSIDLSAGDPATAGWVVRKAATPVGQLNLKQAYNLDGARNSTHTYTWGNRWIPELGRLMAFGNFAMYNDVDNANNVDGFLPIGSNGGTQDPAATYPSAPLGWYGNAKRGTNGGPGNIYAIWGSAGFTVRYFNPNTLTWTASAPANQQSGVIYYPWAYNSAADYMFGLCHGDGSGGSGVRAVKHDPVANRQDAITFNASAGYSAFIAAGEIYAAMDFNPADGCFYWFGQTNIYKVTPNGSTVWDMAIYTPAIGSLLAPVLISGGPVAVGKFMWAEFGSVKGFLWLQGHTGNIQFLRMV